MKEGDHVWILVGEGWIRTEVTVAGTTNGRPYVWVRWRFPGSRKNSAVWRWTKHVRTDEQHAAHLLIQ